MSWEFCLLSIRYSTHDVCRLVSYSFSSWGFLIALDLTLWPWFNCIAHCNVWRKMLYEVSPSGPQSCRYVTLEYFQCVRRQQNVTAVSFSAFSGAHYLTKTTQFEHASWWTHQVLAHLQHSLIIKLHYLVFLRNFSVLFVSSDRSNLRHGIIQIQVFYILFICCVTFKKAITVWDCIRFLLRT